MKNRLFILFLGSLLSLTACGGSTPTKHEVDQYLPEGDPTGTTKVIYFWHCLGQAKTDNLDKVVDKFNEQYAGKYRVKAEALSGDYSSLASDVITKLQSGSVPAMTMGYPDTFADLITNTMEYSSILRLNNFINDPTYGYDVDPETGVLDDFVSGYFNEGRGYQFEGVWSMPMYKSTEVLYYNMNYFCGANPMNDKLYQNTSLATAYTNLKGKCKDKESDTIFQDLQNLKTWVEGHDGFTYEVPQTWQELIQTSKQILADYNGSKTGFYPLGYDSDSNLLISQLEQRGFKYTTNDNIVQARDHYLFGNAANRENTTNLVKEVIKMIKTDKILKTKNTNGNAYSSDSFKEEKCVMSIGSTGGSTYQDADSFVTGLAPVPAYLPDGAEQPNRKYIQQGPSICFFDNRDPFIHKGAWLFYKMMADPENNAKLALDNSYDPVRVSSYDTQYYRDFIQFAEDGHTELVYRIPQITSTLTEYYMTSPVFKGSSTARTEIGNIITYVMRYGKTEEAAVIRAYESCF